MSNIVIAKRELYYSLKSSFLEVTGAGIKSKEGQEYIAIFISHNSPKLITQIPLEFKGNQVRTEVRSLAAFW